MDIQDIHKQQQKRIAKDDQFSKGPGDMVLTF